ncbi:MAG TPA: hypothetical protein VG125_14005 [Pirellulales bacterium]|jgi:hypothetical protein|nr:hypothetical protein [Pirellulales bacterium]
MNRAGYGASIDQFLDRSVEAILGRLVEGYEFAVESTQREAWLVEINLLKSVLGDYRGRGAAYFEYSVPRLGKRIDVVVIVDGAIFVLEFKVGERHFAAQAIDQSTTTLWTSRTSTRPATTA